MDNSNTLFVGCYVLDIHYLTTFDTSPIHQILLDGSLWKKRGSENNMRLLKATGCGWCGSDVDTGEKDARVLFLVSVCMYRVPLSLHISC